MQKGTSMPNPIKYKSVGVSIDAYDKLVYIADKEDRAIGRQLSRMIDDAYEEVVARARPSTPPPRATNLGGLSAVLED
tara:strand:+ start:938 stop:1171 length:234 start_codon:yes stop_codon:yes gene_type:complete